MKNMNEDILDNETRDYSYLVILEDAYTHVKKQLYFRENEIVLKNKVYSLNINNKNNQIKQLTNEINE